MISLEANWLTSQEEIVSASGDLINPESKIKTKPAECVYNNNNSILRHDWENTTTIHAR